MKLTKEKLDEIERHLALWREYVRPTGTYQVTYQYNTRTMRAVQD